MDRIFLKITDLNKASEHQDIIDNPSILRNEFVDVDTGEDLYELLQGRFISAQNEIKKLEKTVINNKDIFKRSLNDEIHMDWNFYGLWFSEGLKYFLTLGKGNRHYFFKRSNSPKLIYEFIPTDDMKIFDLEAYQKTASVSDTESDIITYGQVFDNYDGINLSRPGCKYHGCFWNLKPGFQANLLYKCIDYEIIDRKNNIYRFYFKKNTNPKKNLKF